MTGRDWDLRGARLAGFQFAEWLVINGRPENFGDEYQTDSVRAWAAAEANGWVETVRPPVPDGGWRSAHRPPEPWPRLTGEGDLEVERVRGLRNNPQARAAACREALLLWLAHEGQGAGSAELLVSRDGWRFYDSPFTEQEVRDAATFLQEKGLIEAWTYPGGTVMQPRLTARGTECVDFYGADVRDYLYPRQAGVTVTYQQNFHGTVTGQVGQGPNVTQTQNSNGVDPEALAAAFEAMRDALLTVEDADDRDDLDHGIQQLEAAVDSGDREAVAASAGRLQRLGVRVGKAAGNAVITAAVAAAVNQLRAVLGLG